MLNKIRKLKFTSRRVFRAMMLLIVTLTLVTILLMVLDKNTNFHETTIDIIVLLIGVVALVMAVLTEAELERNARRSNELHREILVALDEIREINRDNESLKRSMRRELEIDQEISKKLDKIAKK
jgi:Ca2+/Na+ antiporter